MRIVFMGSGTFAVPVVQAIRGSAQGSLVAAVTQPDRPRGRGREVKPCPVKQALSAGGTTILTPEKIGDAAGLLLQAAPELIVVADYGQYIPSAIVRIAPHGAINVHPSLLPRYRGAAPIQWAIAYGEAMTGVTIQRVAKKMDAGDILLQQEFDIAPDDTALTLESRLAEAGAALLLRAIDLIRTGHAHATPQDETKATCARKLEKSDGRIEWTRPADVIERRIRAFQPWPGCFCECAGKALKIVRAAAVEMDGTPGMVLACDGQGLLVGTGRGALRLLEVQPEGKRPMAASAWLHGHPLEPGDRLG
jgi:methionyl-tRNA formyltransferase